MSSYMETGGDAIIELPAAIATYDYRGLDYLAPCHSFSFAKGVLGSIRYKSYYVHRSELVGTMARSLLHWGAGHGRRDNKYLKLNETHRRPCSMEQTSCNHRTMTTPLAPPMHTIALGKATTSSTRCFLSMEKTPLEHPLRCIRRFTLFPLDTASVLSCGSTTV